MTRQGVLECMKILLDKGACAAETANVRHARELSWAELLGWRVTMGRHERARHSGSQRSLTSDCSPTCV